MFTAQVNIAAHDRGLRVRGQMGILWQASA
jgi:hypothetical protein